MDGKLSQSLPIPAISAWCVSILDNGDIVVGCSDNRIYVFTTDEKRTASQDLIALFDAELTKFQQPEAMGKFTNTLNFGQGLLDFLFRHG